MIPHNMYVFKSTDAITLKFWKSMHTVVFNSVNSGIITSWQAVFQVCFVVVCFNYRKLTITDTFFIFKINVYCFAGDLDMREFFTLHLSDYYTESHVSHDDDECCTLMKKEKVSDLDGISIMEKNMLSLTTSANE